MRELWWAEAVIAVDADPNWQAARAAIDCLCVHEIPHWEEYVDQLDEELLAAVDPVAAAAPLVSPTAQRDAQLLPHVRQAVHRDFEEVAAALAAGRPYVCAFEAAGFRVYVHCSGYGSAPDHLCDAWLRVDALGLLQLAGFVETRVLDDGC